MKSEITQILCNRAEKYRFICQVGRLIRIFARKNQQIEMRFLSLCALCTAIMLQSCNSGQKDVETWSSDTATQLNDSEKLLPDSPDLRLFELQGNVKNCERTAFYDVKVVNDNPVVDTTRVKPRVTDLYFDELGNYVTSSSELVKRDDNGRITYWRDARPNTSGLAPGMLRDTLNYKYVNHNLLQTSGMGEYAVTVYDNRSRIVGQYSEPAVDGSVMSSFNVYLKEDSEGNWTERLTVWTTKSPKGRPHVSYTLERRKITYY